MIILLTCFTYVCGRFYCNKFTSSNFKPKLPKLIKHWTILFLCFYLFFLDFKLLTHPLRGPRILKLSGTELKISSIRNQNNHNLYILNLMSLIFKFMLAMDLVEVLLDVFKLSDMSFEYMLFCVCNLKIFKIYTKKVDEVSDSDSNSEDEFDAFDRINNPNNYPNKINKAPASILVNYNNPYLSKFTKTTKSRQDLIRESKYHQLLNFNLLCNITLILYNLLTSRLPGVVILFNLNNIYKLMFELRLVFVYTINNSSFQDSNWELNHSIRNYLTDVLKILILFVHSLILVYVPYRFYWLGFGTCFTLY